MFNPALQALSQGELLSEILSYADDYTLTVCLRVSQPFHNIAGRLLYEELDLSVERYKGIFKGSDISLKSKSKTNFKIPLLQLTRYLRIDTSINTLTTYDKRKKAASHAFNDILEIELYTTRPGYTARVNHTLQTCFACNLQNKIVVMDSESLKTRKLIARETNGKQEHLCKCILSASGWIKSYELMVELAKREGKVIGGQ